MSLAYREAPEIAAEKAEAPVQDTVAPAPTLSEVLALVVTLLDSLA